MTDRFDDELPSPEDAALLDRLRAGLGRDELPDGLLARAEGLLAFRDVDRELVELLDTASETVGLRGGVDAPDRLVFEVDGGAVSVEVVLERGELRGQVLAGDLAQVGLERLGGHVRSTAVDSLGTFAFTDPEPGPVRLRLGGSAARLCTDWFVL